MLCAAMLAVAALVRLVTGSSVLASVVQFVTAVVLLLRRVKGPSR